MGDKLVFSFFAGIGFLDLGFEKSGFKVAFVSEFNEPFFKMYKYARAKLNIPEPFLGHSLQDVSFFLRGRGKKLLSEKVETARRNGSFVGFIGGPPCPDFSIGGKNLGSHGKNGKLSGVYVGIIIQQKPDFFVFENVKGLWNTGRHRNYYIQLRNRLRAAGYITVERLVNALEYGAPQDRQRLILVGVKKRIAPDSYIVEARMSRDIESKERPWKAYIKYSIDDVLSAAWPKRTPFRKNRKILVSSTTYQELCVEYWFKRNGVETHLNAKEYFRPYSVRFNTVQEGDSGRKSFKRLHRWRYSPTACYGNNEVHLHPYKNRRLSVAEALAIQSMPKGFELPSGVPLSTKFKAIGNGVPFLAAKAIAEMTRDILDNRVA
jgi:DNA (cytosine-5)-methyltransferase 1